MSKLYAWSAVRVETQSVKNLDDLAIPLKLST